METKRILFVGFSIVWALFPDLATCCYGASLKYGSMTKDVDLEIDSTLTLHCTLLMDTVSLNSSDTYHVTSENLMMKFGNTLLGDVEIVNETTVEYVVHNVTINDTGYYTCFLNISDLSFNPFVCATYVAVGYKPLNVTNFSCISRNYERLNCTWKKPFNPVKTNYQLWDYFQYIQFKRRCPVSQDSSCEWRLDTTPPYRKSPKTLHFMLEGNNSLGSNRQYISVDHYKIVKPAAPHLMQFPEVNKTSLTVKWLPPKGMEYGDIPSGLTYSLHYCLADGQRQHSELCGVVNAGTNTSTVVTGLVPFIEYTFRLKCRTNVPDSMWSPFLNASVRTLPDIPHLAPVTTSSSFQVQNIQKSRTITLYWKPVPSQFQNAAGFGYIIQYQRHYIATTRFKRENLEVDVGNHTAYTFRHMDLKSAYLFRIYAKNDVGISYNSSVIILDKADNLPPSPEDIAVLSYGKGMYNISWKTSLIDTNHIVQNYTLFWCRNIKPRPFNCEGPLEWKTVLEPSQRLNLSDYNTNYQFAVATNLLYSTSGMRWASCVVPYSGVLYKVRDVVVTPKNSTSIRVHWLLDCSAQKKVIQEYAISYCPVYPDLSCSSKPKRINLVNHPTEQYVVGLLKPYTTYKFIVIARTAYGWSEDSDVKYEITMPAAPSDAPRNFQAVSVNETIITVSFQPPLTPNGKITKYSVLYGKVSSSKNSELQRIDYPVEKLADTYEAEISKNGISYYTNYSFVVEACVNLACSPRSEPVYVLTGIGTPGPVDSPNTEVVNATLVNITWKPPDMPNGPIDQYIVTIVWQETEHFDHLNEPEFKRNVINVSGNENSLGVFVDCQQEISDGITYYFSVQALNMKNGTLLYSSPSEPSQVRLCFISPASLSYRILIGLVIGIALGLTVLLLLIYALAKWMKKKVDMVKGITVQLPTGLDSPIENPLNTYDKFKSGLQKNRDSGIASERTYERLCSYSSDRSAKNLENSYDTSTEEFLVAKGCREKTGRNQSGDSSVSCKGHDSISSSNTNKTHISVDSGTEMDLPPSPDGMFSDTSSTNTTPRSYKPDLEIVEENRPTNSKDSGLDKEGVLPPLAGSRGTDISHKFPYYIRKKNHIYFSGQALKKNGQIQPYSKFTIVASAFTPNYVPLGVQNLNLLDQQSLANSEPSVADFQDDSDSEPLMLSGVPPYCRFGLARSVGNGLNITNQAFPVQQNLGYSKFGIIYSTIRKPENGELQDTACAAPSYSKITWPKLKQNTSTSSSLLGRPTHSSCHKSLKQKPLDVLEEKPDTSSCSDVKFLDDTETLKELCQNASSLVGNNTLDNVNTKKCATNGYVSFNHALSEALSAANTEEQGLNSCKADAHRKNKEDQSFIADCALMDVMPDNVNDTCQHGDGQDPGIVTPSFQLQKGAQEKSNGYVTFRDAKIMTQHDPHSQDAVEGEIPDDCLEVVNGVVEDFDLAEYCASDFMCKPEETESDSVSVFHNQEEANHVLVTPNDLLLEVNDFLSGGHEKVNGESLRDFAVSQYARQMESCKLDPEKTLPNGPTSPLHPQSQMPLDINEVPGTEREPVTTPKTVSRQTLPLSNGYVPYSEIVGSEKECDSLEVITVPNSTSDSLHIVNV